MSWPKWKYTSKICCVECHRVYNILCIDLDCYCPNCYENKKM
jgi:hypothetical protein